MFCLEKGKILFAPTFSYITKDSHITHITSVNVLLIYKALPQNFLIWNKREAFYDYSLLFEFDTIVTITMLIR